MVGVSVLTGVLALQGDFAAHLAVIDSCGYRSRAVRTREDLEEVDALIVPGGESTAILKLIERYDLRDPIVKRVEKGMPVFGTCAGAIVLAQKSSDGEPPLGLMPIEVVRNAYGRQRDSFETELEVGELNLTIQGIFIRAPVLNPLDPAVKTMATWEGHPVLLRHGSALVSTFHPELSGNSAIHRFFVEQMCSEGNAA